MDAAVDLARREAGRRRIGVYRDRKRRGVMVVRIEVGPSIIQGLERLGMLTVGERDPADVGAAASQFLAAAPSVAALGDALFPAVGPLPDRSAIFSAFSS